MTVNERLSQSGLLGPFDEAVRSRSRRDMLDLLTRCGLSEAQAETTVKAILASPGTYGY
jgi:hypothetical protein